MKKSVLVMLVFFANNFIYSQSNIPDLLNLTAIARNQNNQLVSNDTIDVQVEIWSGTSSPTNNEYCELYTNILTNQNGEFSIQFGINPQYLCQSSPNMDNVPWENGEMWYKLYYRVTGGNLILIDTRRISSVPYAFASRTAEKLVTTGINGQVLTYQNGNWVGAAPTGGGTDSQQLSYNSSTGNISLTNGGTPFKTPTADYVKNSVTSLTSIPPITWSSVGGSVTDPIPSNGDYVINSNIYTSGPANASIAYRVTKSSDGFNTFSIVHSQIVLYGHTIAAQGSASFQSIASLIQGERLRLEVLTDTNGVQAGTTTTQNFNGVPFISSSSITAIRLK